MARPTRWDRRYSISSALVASSSFSAEIARLQPGETLTRVRFQYDLSRVRTTIPFAPDGLIWAVGIQVTPTTAAPTTNPINNPNIDWVWWEGVSPRAVMGYINSANAAQTVKSSAPIPPDERDAQAQRRNVSEVAQSVWLQARCENQGGQGDMFFSWSTSTLVLLAV